VLLSQLAGFLYSPPALLSITLDPTIQNVSASIAEAAARDCLKQYALRAFRSRNPHNYSRCFVSHLHHTRVSASGMLCGSRARLSASSASPSILTRRSTSRAPRWITQTLRASRLGASQHNARLTAVPSQTASVPDVSSGKNWQMFQRRSQ